jgi:hypothetical protein
VKRSITITLTIIAVFCLISKSLAARYREPTPSRRDRASQTGTTRTRRGIKDANSLIKDFPYLKDPNAINAKVNEFEGLQARIDEVCKKDRREFGKWTRLPIDDPTGLATEVQKQIIAEMVMIRELAAEEGAVKTTAAIDSLLIDRQDRLDKIIKRMSVKLRDQQGSDPETGNPRNSYRDNRGRGRDRNRGNTGYSERDSRRGTERGYRDRGRYDEQDQYKDQRISDRPIRREREITRKTTTEDQETEEIETKEETKE